MGGVGSYTLPICAVASLVEIEQEDVDRHPSPLVFFAPHEDAPFPVLFARQIAEE